MGQTVTSLNGTHKSKPNFQLGHGQSDNNQNDDVIRFVEEVATEGVRKTHPAANNMLEQKSISKGKIDGHVHYLGGVPTNMLTNGVFDKKHNTPIIGDNIHTRDQLLVGQIDEYKSRNLCLTLYSCEAFLERSKELGNLTAENKKSIEETIAHINRTVTC